MGFKEVIKQDLIKTFFNTSEFADTHQWDRTTIVAIMDRDDIVSKISTSFEMLEKGCHCILAPKTQFQSRPLTHSAVVFDGDAYTVDEIKEEDGMYIIFLIARGRGYGN